MTTKRCSISIEEELAARFDELFTEMGYETRSEAIRDLIQNALVKNEIENPDVRVIGTLSIIFDHGKYLSHKLINEQLKYIGDIVSISKVHLSAEMTFEAIIIRSTAGRAMDISSRIIGIRGVSFGELTILPDR
jgi:CopG family nickel-responsive transcriptional regulator